jgi:hypothetical protein
MEPIPVNCMDINSVGSFCDCIENTECVDEAARDFCTRARTDSGKNITGDDLAELKKALMETDCEGCCEDCC